MGRDMDEVRHLKIMHAQNGLPRDSAYTPIERSSYDLVQHIYRQRAFSKPTFGPGHRTEGVLDHILKEVEEVRAEPLDIFEWCDLILLALDGAWRTGFTPEQIVAALEAKLSKNEGRDWPDWRAADPNKAITHIKAQHQPTLFNMDEDGHPHPAQTAELTKTPPNAKKQRAAKPRNA